MIDPLLQPSQRGSGSSDGYFEGVVGLKQDGTALLERRSPKPVFAMPFYAHAPAHAHAHAHAHAQPPSGMLAAPEMEKRGSHGPPEGYAKW